MTIFSCSLDEFLQTIPEVSPEQKKPIINMLNRADMGLEGAHDWHDVSANRLKDYDGVKGDMQVNWKDKGYSTILDVLMVKLTILTARFIVWKSFFPLNLNYPDNNIIV